MDNEKKKIRKEFYKVCIEQFNKTQLNSVSDDLKLDSQSLSFIDDNEILAEKLINAYEVIVDNIIRPIISKDEKSLIDLYKILSVIEYSIMIEKPFIYQEKNSLQTNLFNAHFAFYTALSFLSGWDGYCDVMKNQEGIEAFLNSTEIERRPSHMSIKDEHIAIIALSADIANIPFFSNASWWRVISHNFVNINKLRN